MNALDFVGPLLKNVNQVIVPDKAIINTHQKWDSLKTNDFKEFAVKFSNQNSNDKYEWRVYGKEVQLLNKAINNLKDLIEISYWNRWMASQEDNDFLVLRQRGDELLFLNSVTVDAPKEVFVPLYDYINLINQYLIAEEGHLDQVDDILERHPHLEELYQQINEHLL